MEKNSAPGASSIEVQSLINNDIPEYDLFIGLLWLRFGTPTKNFGSGTEEEFEIAYSKFLNEQNSVQILFYFKNALPNSINDIDPEQLSKVKKFKKSLGEKSILFWDFEHKEDLCRFLRTHIPTRIENLRKTSNLKTINLKEKPNISSIIIETEDEYGILDYQEFIEESLENSNQSLSKINDATEVIGKEINKKAEEINRLVANNHNQPIGAKVQRNIFVRTANIVNDYANRIEPEIPIYMSNFERGIDALSKLINIYKSDFEDKNKELNEIKLQLKSLINNLPGAIENTKGFLEALESWPRMSKELNNSRKNAAEKLRELISKIETSHTIAVEVYKSI